MFFLLYLRILSCRSHLPLMFVGMEHIMLSNFDMADEALNAAHKMCDGDPLLYNERGVMSYNRGEYVLFYGNISHAFPHCSNLLNECALY